MWNGFVLRELVQQAELSRFCLPIMHGCILCSVAVLHAWLSLSLLNLPVFVFVSQEVNRVSDLQS